MKNIPWVSKSWYYKIQDKYIFGIAREAWKKEQPRFEQKTWYIIYTSNRGWWMFQQNGKSRAYKGARKGKRKAVENKIVNH